MAKETLSTVPPSTPEKGPSGSDPKEPPVGVNNFEQINAMYSAFSSKRKEVNHTSVYNNDDHPIIEPWWSDSEGSPEEAIRRAPEETTLQAKPSKHASLFFLWEEGKGGGSRNASQDSIPFLSLQEHVRKKTPLDHS
ncbi:hypothetical protein Tco_1289633 [Tanacetum coccineum]